MSLRVLLLWLVACAAAWPAPAAAQTLPVLGVTVTCDLDGCGSEAYRQELARLVPLRPGDAFDPDALDRGRALLESTGLFSRVELERAVDDRGVEVRVTLTRAVRIAEVSISPGGALTSEIRRRVFLRSGEVWRDDPVVIERQSAAIREYFETAGYFGSRVTITATPRGPRLVDVTIDVDRGQPLTVRRILVRGNTTLAYADIRDLVLNEMSLTRQFTSARLRRATEAILGKYRELGRYEARVTRDDVHRDARAGTVDLYIELREGPRWQVEFVGSRQFDDAELTAAAQLGQNGYIDDGSLRQSSAAIADAYESIGHFFARVRATETEDPTGERLLRFEINEGPQLPIRSVRIDGMPPELLPDTLASLETQPLSAFRSGGFLIRRSVQSDLGRIRDALESSGRLSGRMVGLSVTASLDPAGLDVVFEVAAGAQTTVSGVRVVTDGQPSRPPTGLTLRRGEPLDPGRLRDDHARLLATWFDRGFSRATVVSSCVAGDGSESECGRSGIPPDCERPLAWDDPSVCDTIEAAGQTRVLCRLASAEPRCAVPTDTPAVEVRHRIVTGPRSVFGDVFLAGHFRTRNAALRDEVPFRPGEAFQLQRLLRTQADLRALGLFESVRARTVDALAADGTPAQSVVFEFEEIEPWTLDHSVGMELQLGGAGRELVIVSNEPVFRHRNFLGRLEELRLDGNFDFDLQQSEQVGAGELRAGGSVSYFDPRFRFGGLTRDPAEGLVEAHIQRDRLTPAPAPQIDEIGTSARFRDESRRVRGLYLELELSFRVTTSRDPGVASTISSERAAILSATPKVTFDRRNHPLRPSDGFLTEFSIELADDFLGLSDARAFTKLDARGIRYWSLTPDLVLATQIRLGYATGGLLSGFATDRLLALPVSERFLLGGSTTLRGFADGGVRAAGTSESGGDVIALANAELRYPLIGSIGLEGAAFFDVGEIATGVDTLAVGELRSSAGLGLRLVVAKLIPITLDYGANLERRFGEPFGRLHLNVGYTF